MSGRILIVDDVETNLRLMEARLRAEYFEVTVARSGPEALDKAQREAVDLVLLDVMMPGMDGYEVCRRLKGDPATAHLPVVLVTALDDASDRVQGLDAGADDFLTKPVRDLQLFSRVRSLTRLKIVTDELRVRAETTMNLVSRADLFGHLASGGTGGRLLVFEEDERSAERVFRALRSEHALGFESDPEAFLESARTGQHDLFVVSLSANRYDPLRLCSQLRASPAARFAPILLIAEAHDEARTARALEIGANDYLVRPIDRNELLARVRTQVRRKRYDEGLRRSVRETIELAVTDPLTGLHNRRFLESHLARAIDRARADGKPLALLIADIDHFKRINDGWGHDAGDAVLRQFAERLRRSLRGSDLACRLGGEEFVVLMPDAEESSAAAISERVRKSVAEDPFDLMDEPISVTVSVGYAVFDPVKDDVQSLMKRADRSLYAAKQGGRNRVVSLAA